MCPEYEDTDQEEGENKSDEDFVPEGSELWASLQARMNKQANHVVQNVNPCINQRYI